MKILQIPKIIDTTAIDSLDRLPNKISQDIDSLAYMNKDEFISAISKDASLIFSPESIEYLVRGLIGFGLKLLAALAIYAIGAWIIKKCRNLLTRIFTKRNTDRSLASFVSSMVSISLTVLLIVITISTLGINTTSIAAVLAAGGMAIGMAMSGTVQNFAGGIMILVFKPFKSGDFIEAQGFSGTVTDIDIFSTKLVTYDNKVIMIPNGALSNGTINNYSKQEMRRVSWIIGVEYGTDFDSLKEFIASLIDKDTRIDQNFKKPFIGIESLSASSVDIAVKVWVKTADYWDVFYAYNAIFYKELPEHGFNFPFPQMDVWIRKNSPES